MNLRTTTRLLVLAVLLEAVRAAAEGGAPPPAASPAAQEAKPPPANAKAPASAEDRKRSAARSACTERADYLFVGRCRQSCQVEAKGKQQAKARKCVAACGKQPQRALFIKDCMAKAGYP